MRLGLVARTDLSVSLRQKVSPSLNRHWNKKLRQPFALAPADWLEQGLVTETIYHHQNKVYGDAVSNFIRKELEDMKHDLASYLEGGVFTVNGVGTFRDTEWVHDANQLGLRGIFLEAASWPARHAKEILTVRDAATSNVIRRLELKGDPSEIDPDTLLLLESAFKQILDKPTKDAISRRQGQHLRQSHHKRRIVIVHPFARDNKETVRWGDLIDEELRELLPTSFPFDNRGVKWGDTTPYSLRELTDPIEDGLGRPVTILRKEKLRYYHQTYTLMTIIA